MNTSSSSLLHIILIIENENISSALYYYRTGFVPFSTCSVQFIRSTVFHVTVAWTLSLKSYNLCHVQTSHAHPYMEITNLQLECFRQ